MEFLMDLHLDSSLSIDEQDRHWSKVRVSWGARDLCNCYCPRVRATPPMSRPAPAPSASAAVAPRRRALSCARAAGRRPSRRWPLPHQLGGTVVTTRQDGRRPGKREPGIWTV